MKIYRITPQQFVEGIDFGKLEKPDPYKEFVEDVKRLRKDCKLCQHLKACRSGKVTAKMTFPFCFKEVEQISTPGV